MTEIATWCFSKTVFTWSMSQFVCFCRHIEGAKSQKYGELFGQVSTKASAQRGGSKKGGWVPNHISVWSQLKLKVGDFCFTYSRVEDTCCMTDTPLSTKHVTSRQWKHVQLGMFPRKKKEKSKEQQKLNDICDWRLQKLVQPQQWRPSMVKAWKHRKNS